MKEKSPKPEKSSQVKKQENTKGKSESVPASNQMTAVEYAWKLITILRDETLNIQKIRAQVIGIKITTITLGLGFILDRGVSPVVYIVVAYAAVLFDFLITSYSIAIKRNGLYIRVELEDKIIRKGVGWPSGVPLWEEFMVTQKSTQQFAIYGNLGLTGLASILAFASSVMPVDPKHFQFPGMVVVTYILLFGLACLLILDFQAHLKPQKIFDGN